MNAEDRIRELVQATLADNRDFDGVGFIDQLFLVASEVGEIKCTLANDRGLRFQTPHQPAWDVELDRAKAKLRMLCARLGVVCQEHNGRFVNLYGDEAALELGIPPQEPRKWAVRFKNTPSEQEFLIQAQ